MKVDPGVLSHMSLGDIEGMTGILPIEEIAAVIIEAKAINIRDVGAGQPAYHYSSGNYGPGYVMIKGLVGKQKVFKFLARQLALRLAGVLDFDCIAGLVTGGVIPSVYLREYLQDIQGREIPLVYIRETRKAGGAGEQITGIIDITTGDLNPEIPLGARFAVMEELTNFANSLTNGAETLRKAGYSCSRGFSLLDYANSDAERALTAAEVSLTCLITLPELLAAAEESGAFSKQLIDDYNWFRSDPEAWMARYGYKKKEHTR